MSKQSLPESEEGVCVVVYNCRTVSLGLEHGKSTQINQRIGSVRTWEDDKSVLVNDPAEEGNMQQVIRVPDTVGQWDSLIDYCQDACR